MIPGLGASDWICAHQSMCANQNFKKKINVLYLEPRISSFIRWNVLPFHRCNALVMNSESPIIYQCCIHERNKRKSPWSQLNIPSLDLNSLLHVASIFFSLSVVWACFVNLPLCLCVSLWVYLWAVDISIIQSSVFLFIEQHRRHHLGRNGILGNNIWPRATWG